MFSFTAFKQATNKKSKIPRSINKTTTLFSSFKLMPECFRECWNVSVFWYLMKELWLPGWLSKRWKPEVRRFQLLRESSISILQKEVSAEFSLPDGKYFHMSCTTVLYKTLVSHLHIFHPSFRWWRQESIKTSVIGVIRILRDLMTLRLKWSNFSEKKKFFSFL